MKTRRVTFFVHSIAGLLASAAGASFAAAPTAALNHDPDTYRSVTQQAAANYQAAITQCVPLSGNAKDVCIEGARAARAHAEADALAKYNNTEQGRIKARTTVADADFKLAQAKCGALPAADQPTCQDNARAVHTAALADAKGTRTLAVADASPVAQNARSAASSIASTTGKAADAVAAKAAVMADKSSEVVADSVITTKVKADIFKEPELKSMAIHVETDNGVVMLSGFVDSQADADKAAQLAREVKGVSTVRSALKVR